MLTIVNAWALEPELYLYALAAATGQLWSVMFVETRLRHEQAWIAAIKGANPDMTFLVASPHQTPGL